MVENMRYLVKTDEVTMIQQTIDDAKKIGLPMITRENIYWEGGVAKDSVMKIKYQEIVKLYGDKRVILKMEAVKEIRPPSELP